MQYKILPFSRDVFFMNPPFRYWLYSLSCGFMCFSNTTESGLCFRCLGIFCFRNNGYPQACLGERSFAWHCSFLWCLQLSPCILNDVLVPFITLINRINFSQFSGAFEFRFLDCPFFFFEDNTLKVGQCKVTMSFSRSWTSKHASWDCPFLFLPYFSGFSNSCPGRQAICNLDVMSFGCLSVSLPGPPKSFWRSFVQ